jgi:hypothetical protein
MPERVMARPGIAPRMIGVRSRAVFVAVNVVAFAGVALIAAGCLTQASRGRALHEAAYSLLPGQHRILLDELGNCIELALSPSCVQVYFIADKLSLSERVQTVEERAQAASWDFQRKETLAGGVDLRFRRKRLHAIVTLARSEIFRRGGCDEKRAKNCADVVSVERGG